MEKIKKLIDIRPDSSDAIDFASIVERIIDNLIRIYNFDEISIVKVKNWFDHKWLNYSGKSIIHFEGTPNPDKVAITNVWKKKITVPPFNPNRILDEKLIRRKGHSNPIFEKVLHKVQRSTDNLDNYIHLISDKGLLVWYSSNSKINNQGCIMVYMIENDDIDSWYVSFENRYDWIVKDSKGINLKVINRLIDKK